MTTIHVTASRDYDVLVQRGPARRCRRADRARARHGPHGGHRRRGRPWRAAVRPSGCSASLDARGLSRRDVCLSRRRALQDARYLCGAAGLSGRASPEPQRPDRRARRRRDRRPGGLCRRDVSARHARSCRCRRRCWPRWIPPSAARRPWTSPSGKNQVGCFYQPSLVLCDPDTLRTLPPEEYRSGCAEVIKYAVLRSEPFFSELRTAPVSAQVEHVIATCVDYEARPRRAPTSSTAAAASC